MPYPLLPMSDDRAVRTAVAFAMAQLDAFTTYLVRAGCTGEGGFAHAPATVGEGDEVRAVDREALEADAARGMLQDTLTAAAAEHGLGHSTSSDCDRRVATIHALLFFADHAEMALLQLGGKVINGRDGFRPWTPKEWETKARRVAARLGTEHPEMDLP